MKVKFINLTFQTNKIREDVSKKFNDIINNSSFVSGKFIEEFEKKFAEYTRVKHCIAVNNGTSALYLSLIANDVGHGDEVVIPVNTFIATAEAISLSGAKPVFVDIDENTYLINPQLIEQNITKKTKAIIPVHLYGQCANIDLIKKIANKHKLKIIEDACQAHGSEHRGKKAGSLGDCAAFSFYPGKNLGAWGEGGAITTSDNKLATRLRLLRNHGSRIKYSHEIIGGNFRLDEFQGAVLSSKFKYLDLWNSERTEIARKYVQKLSGIDSLFLPQIRSYNKTNWHLFVIRTKKRNILLKYLNEMGINAMVHYPTPLHLTKAYEFLGLKRGDFPIAESVVNEIISLPIYPELKMSQINYIASCIVNYFSRSN